MNIKECLKRQNSNAISVTILGETFLVMYLNVMDAYIADVTIS